MSPRFRWILIASGLLKLALAIAFADIPPRYDETEFLAYGRAIAEEGAAPVLWRAPGYQWFVATGLLGAGGRVIGVRLLQVLLSVAASFLVYRIGRRRFGERVGLAAGAFVAFYPSHVAFSHLLWSETLYGFLILWGAERALAADERGSSLAALVAGALLGAAVLTRSLGALMLAATAVWILLGRGGTEAAGRRRRDRMRLAAALLVGGVLVVLPWSLSASRWAGRAVLVDVNTGFNLWSGNNEYIPADAPGLWSVGLGLENGVTLPLPDTHWRGDVVARMRADGVVEQLGPDGDLWYRREALSTIRADPVGFIARMPRKLCALWAPDFFLPRHLLRDWYGRTPPPLATGLTWLTWLAAAVPLLGGAAALAVLRRDRLRLLTLLWLGVSLLAHVIAYGHTRMHQPLVPFLVLAVAAVVFAEQRPVVRAGGCWGRGLFWGGVALATWVIISPLVGGLYLMPGPRHAGCARTLAAGRHLPLAGSHRLAWMLAGVEAAAGRTEAADAVLAEPGIGERAWSLLLRGLLAPDIERREELLREALERDPELYDAAWHLARSRLARGDSEGAIEYLRRAVAILPWSRPAQELLLQLTADLGERGGAS